MLNGLLENVPIVETSVARKESLQYLVPVQPRSLPQPSRYILGCRFTKTEVPPKLTPELYGLRLPPPFGLFSY